MGVEAGGTAVDPAVASLQVLATPPPWLTAAAQGARVAEALRRDVPELRDGPEQLTACRVEDLRLKGSQWIGRYVVTLAQPDREPRSVALVGMLNAGGVPAELQRTDAPFESPDWRVALTDPSLVLSTAAGDRRLAGLALITDPGTARAWLERSLSQAFPGIRIAFVEPVVARYRPGQRCTVVCHLTYGDEADASWPDVVVAKLHRRGEGAHEYGALQALAAAGLGDSGSVLTARPRLPARR